MVGWLQWFLTMGAGQSLEEARKDSAKERQKLFVQASIEKFNCLREIYRTAYHDPKDAPKKNSKLYQTTGGAVESATSSCIKALLPGDLTGGKLIGKATGKAVGWTAKKVLELLLGSNDKKQAQTVSQLLEDYSANKVEWQCYLARTFVEIFNHHHIQFVHLMERLPEDMTESKLMGKLAHDATKKIFHALETEEDIEKNILHDKDFLIRVFIKGKVESGLIEKAMSKLPYEKGLPHRQLRFKNQEDKEMKVTTYDIFTKVDIYCPRTKTYYQAKDSNKEVLWRRQFSCESEDDLVKRGFTLNRTQDDPQLQEYEKREPTFVQLPAFDGNGDYLNHIKLDLKVEGLELKVEKPFIVLMCGQTGSGKSTLSTIMTGNKYKDFKISNVSSNFTVECENNGKDGHPFLGIEGSGRKIRIIDAPGLGNSPHFQISDGSIVKEVKDYMGERNLQNTDQISALLWIEDAKSFGRSAQMRVERYISRISPEAMKIIIMIFNKAFDDDDESLATLTKAFKTALSTAAKKQFVLSDDDLKQSIDDIPCILLKQCDELVDADQMEDEVLKEFIDDNKEQLENLLECVKAKRAINSFKVFDDKSKKDQNQYHSIKSSHDFK